MEIKSDCLLLKLFHFVKREMKNIVYIKVNLKKNSCIYKKWIHKEIIHS